jgi:hypothetical protein
VNIYRLISKADHVNLPTELKLMEFLVSFFFFFLPQFTWVVLHYHKGSAFYTERQELLKKTLWEQIDDGKAYTPTKKFLTLVPVVLCVFFCSGSRLAVWNVSPFSLPIAFFG